MLDRFDGYASGQSVTTADEIWPCMGWDMGGERQMMGTGAGTMPMHLQSWPEMKSENKMRGYKLNINLPRRCSTIMKS